MSTLLTSSKVPVKRVLPSKISNSTSLSKNKRNQKCSHPLRGHKEHKFIQPSSPLCSKTETWGKRHTCFFLQILKEWIPRPSMSLRRILEKLNFVLLVSPLSPLKLKPAHAGSNRMIWTYYLKSLSPCHDYLKSHLPVTCLGGCYCTSVHSLSFQKKFFPRGLPSIKIDSW